MRTERWVVAGLAAPRAPWFADVARWATSGLLPVEFLKCVGTAEVRRRLTADRPVSALLVDASICDLDRELIAEVRATGTAVVVIDDRRIERDWIGHGADTVLAAPFGAERLLDTLSAHATKVDGSALGGTPRGAVERDEDGRGEDGPSWRGRLVAVTGASGCGASVAAMALAQGLARQPGNVGAVALADLDDHGDLAMYHDVGDVVPGLREVVELYRDGPTTRAELRRHLYEIDDRGYALLLGLRRTGDRSALRRGPFERMLDGMSEAFRVVVVDVRCDGSDGDGPSAGGVGQHGVAARSTLPFADAVVVCGDASLKGLHGLARAERDVVEIGADPGRIVRVVNRAPRAPRRRAEVTAAVHDLGTGAAFPLGPVFLPERRQLDLVHAVAGVLPTALVTPLVAAVGSVLRDSATTPGSPSRTPR